MGGGEVEAETMMPIDSICYDLLNNCILVDNLLHSDWARIVIGDRDTIDYEQLFAWEYRSSISNHCTITPS